MGTFCYLKSSIVKRWVERPLPRLRSDHSAGSSSPRAVLRPRRRRAPTNEAFKRGGLATLAEGIRWREELVLILGTSELEPAWIVCPDTLRALSSHATSIAERARVISGSSSASSRLVRQPSLQRLTRPPGGQGEHAQLVVPVLAGRLPAQSRRPGAGSSRQRLGRSASFRSPGGCGAILLWSTGGTPEARRGRVLGKV